MKFSRGHNTVKMTVELWYLFDKILYLYQVLSKYLIGFQKFSKGHNSVNCVGGVMVLVLFTLSDSVYFCTKFCQSIA